MINYPLIAFQKKYDINSEKLNELNNSLYSLIVKNDYYNCRKIVDTILQNIRGNTFDTLALSDSYYLVGFYFLSAQNLNEAIKYLNLSIACREKIEIFDYRYAKAFYNLGYSYSQLGDFKKHEDYSLKSLEVEKKIAGDTSPSLIPTYSSLISASIQLHEYERSISYSNIALNIGVSNPDSVPPLTMAGLYNNLGVCYTRLADYSKANILFDKAETIYRINHLNSDENYINLMNNLAISYGAMNLSERSNEYYETGIKLALTNNSTLAFNIINSYAIILGNSGKVQSGESILKEALDRAKNRYKKSSREYIEVLNNYADYLREYKINNKKSIECYLQCLDYLKQNKYDLNLKNPVIIGYSLSLNENGESEKALETIQSLLFSNIERNEVIGIYDNPSLNSIKPDRTSLRIYKAKYKILTDIYRKSHDQKVLEAASGTSGLIVLLLEKVRINISEEDSRLILGDRYRDSYLNAISDFNILYKATGGHQYLEKAFEYSEKSKVAGLLTSTRELKAAQFHIPSDIAEFEKSLQRNLSLLNAKITEESGKQELDTMLINSLKDKLLETTRRRDSLIIVFEKEYPDYFAFKYNTQVAKLEDIPDIVGRNGNYINYIVSDTTLYIFVANRKNQQLLTVPIDSTFNYNINQFRNMLSKPSPSDNAKKSFEKYQSIGYELYKTLIDPVRPYFISSRLLISPDNILSYLPFETIPTKSASAERVLYRNLNYLMDDFDISYTYSATFLAESVKKDFSFNNKAIAFSPNYPKPIDIKSVLLNRQSESGVLLDLPYARLEAEYVADITGGNLFENSNARESVYKSEAGKYDIIHLAMHTLLNDKDPMYSTLIFSPENDSIEDGYLKTYEVYGIPLKSRMVVLSSCNTGTGLLSSGEGILSLARGFIFSGSQSVVMSMWEIEDKSGTDIVKMFYANLKKGYPKSLALRKARMAYLEKADQLRSHPYFWSALVIYGNNSPLYYSKYLLFSVPVLLIIAGFFFFFFCKRKYS